MDLLQKLQCYFSHNSLLIESINKYNRVGRKCSVNFENVSERCGGNFANLFLKSAHLKGDYGRHRSAQAARVNDALYLFCILCAFHTARVTMCTEKYTTLAVYRKYNSISSAWIICNKTRSLCWRCFFQDDTVYCFVPLFRTFVWKKNNNEAFKNLLCYSTHVRLLTVCKRHATTLFRCFTHVVLSFNRHSRFMITFLLSLFYFPHLWFIYNVFRPLLDDFRPSFFHEFSDLHRKASKFEKPNGCDMFREMTRCLREKSSFRQNFRKAQFLKGSIRFAACSQRSLYNVIHFSKFVRGVFIEMYHSMKF